MKDKMKKLEILICVLIGLFVVGCATQADYEAVWDSPEYREAGKARYAGQTGTLTGGISMEPLLYKGSKYYIDYTNYYEIHQMIKDGQPVYVLRSHQGKMIVHEVIKETLRATFITKGINNEFADVEPMHVWDFYGVITPMKEI